MKKSRKVGVSNTEVGWNIHIHTNTNTQIEYTKNVNTKNANKQNKVLS